MKFSIGQNIYINKIIRGWFDHSMKSEIPIGAVGTIIDCDYISYDQIVYVVQFDKEFGIQLLSEDALKLG